MLRSVEDVSKSVLVLRALTSGAGHIGRPRETLLETDGPNTAGLNLAKLNDSSC